MAGGLRADILNHLRSSENRAGVPSRSEMAKGGPVGDTRPTSPSHLAVQQHARTSRSDQQRRTRPDMTHPLQADSIPDRRGAASVYASEG